MAEEDAIGQHIKRVRHTIQELQAGRIGPLSPYKRFQLQAQAASDPKPKHYRTKFTSLDGWEQHLAETHREIETLNADMQTVAVEVGWLNWHVGMLISFCVAELRGCTETCFSSVSYHKPQSLAGCNNFLFEGPNILRPRLSTTLKLALARVRAIRMQLQKTLPSWVTWD